MAIPLISSIATATGAGPTLLAYRNRLADELGMRQSTTVSTTATHGEAARMVLADELRDDEVQYEFLGRPWVYARTGTRAGEQRRIMDQPGVGHLGNYGGLTVSRPFSGAVAAGSTIDVTSPLPMKQHMGIRGIQELVNEALARIWIEARITITGNGTQTYDLGGTYPWIETYEQTNGIYDTVEQGAGMPSELSPYRYRFIANGVDRTLVTDLTYDSSTTFALAVIVRADRLIYDGASWSYVTTPGLQDDTDQAAAREEQVVAFGMVKGLQFLTKMILASKQMGKEEKSERLYGPGGIMSQRRSWAQQAVLIKKREFPRPLPERKEAMASVGYVGSWPYS